MNQIWKVGIQKFLKVIQKTRTRTVDILHIIALQMPLESLKNEAFSFLEVTERGVEEEEEEALNSIAIAWEFDEVMKCYFDVILVPYLQRRRKLLGFPFWPHSHSMLNCSHLECCCLHKCLCNNSCVIYLLLHGSLTLRLLCFHLPTSPARMPCPCFSPPSFLRFYHHNSTTSSSTITTTLQHRLQSWC